MTKDEIKKMVYEAYTSAAVASFTPMTDEALERFAALVAEKEREACAKVCEEREEQWRKAGFFKDIHEFREMAFAIRARGNK